MFLVIFNVFLPKQILKNSVIYEDNTTFFYFFFLISPRRNTFIFSWWVGFAHLIIKETQIKSHYCAQSLCNFRDMRIQKGSFFSKDISWTTCVQTTALVIIEMLQMVCLEWAASKQLVQSPWPWYPAQLLSSPYLSSSSHCWAGSTREPAPAVSPLHSHLPAASIQPRNAAKEWLLTHFCQARMLVGLLRDLDSGTIER